MGKRKMYLTNKLGETYSLNPSDPAALYNLSDLGYEISAEYRRIGDMYRMIAEPRAQVPITGQIYFVNGDQKEYRKFVNFLQFKPLTLHYDPTGDDEYMIDGTVTKVGYNDGSSRIVTVTFKPTCPPYKMITQVVQPVDSSIQDGKNYAISEDEDDPQPDCGYYVYSYRYRASNSNSVKIRSETVMDCPVKLTIYGPLTNPEWTQYVNGKKVASGKITRTVPAGDYIVIDTHSTPYAMGEYDSADNFVMNLYQSSNFGTERFLTLKYGENLVAVTDEGGNDVMIKLEGKIFYASV